MSLQIDLNELSVVLEALQKELPSISNIAHTIAEKFSQGHKLLACGNGGSAADALHLCEELTGRYRENRKALPAICLSADGTALTCIGNDFGFDQVFSRQVEALGKEGDVLVAFSTSGDSVNICKALEEAQKRGLWTILLTGKEGGRSRSLASESICIASSNSARIQEAHCFVLHSLLEVLEEKLFS